MINYQKRKSQKTQSYLSFISGHTYLSPHNSICKDIKIIQTKLSDLVGFVTSWGSSNNNSSVL